MVTRPGETDHPAPLSALVDDLVGYSKLTGKRQAKVREELDGIRERAARAAGLDRSSWYVQDRGDGELALVPVTVPKARLVADYVRELVTELGEYNQSRNAEGRIRLRVALHHGDVRGFAGDPTVVACRLLDSQPLRDALGGSPDADLALILSDQMYQATAAQRERGLDPRRFRRVEVRQEKFQGVGWITVFADAPGDLGDQGPAAEPARPPGRDDGGGVHQDVRDNARAVGIAHGPTNLGDNSLVAERVDIAGRDLPFARRRNERGRAAPDRQRP